ncbi:PduM family microcompartment protein [Loigolactobacillus coryniformis]|jgi:microcompartment protein PduM|uniref:Microcompartment protein PduM n=4 Tax=Loigolactobacillus coryniformis TaxID=1610 RepID=J2ZUK8_9LACO|nr:PduM family microcompartment protein [Loigolactobacillus coryniformis]MDT3391745.1 PduM family microcompartment protein [Bacillota bacterium]OEH89671.1 microcompartment protein PduM [Loigolactobacillus coryniformis subsp. coryniformis]RRG06307.1 MAG: microcompartment protein PduM [Lactobacillus sp.]ATO43124.1 microcompartment protein PduM [Loigolactobacillus coryniformis subsp. torquens DSM 20004 = KCTC 3535]ATO54880.1 microcompartment protein PduM [Loigolactobacillus coryniformis subsp. co
MNEELIQQVLARLQKRQQQKIDFFYQSDQPAPSATIYYDYASVTVQNVSIPLIRDLYRMDVSDPWVQWLMTGIGYRVHLTLAVSFKQLDFIPLPMLTAWALKFKTYQQQPIAAFEQTQITRRDLVKLPPKSVVLKTHAQKITMLGQEELVKRQLVLQERSNRTCIWEK